MNVVIRSIDKVIFTGVATEITLPGLFGKLGIRPNHAPMSVVLAEGEINIKTTDTKEHFSVKNGIAQISGTAVDILLMP